MFSEFLWMFAIAPAVALLAFLLWSTSPLRRRDPVLRGVLIVSVGISGIEAMLALLAVGVLVLFSLSGGMENF